MAQMIDPQQAYGVIATNRKYARAVIKVIRIDMDHRETDAFRARIRQSGLLRHGTAWYRLSPLKGCHIEIRLRAAVSPAKAIHIRRMLGDDTRRLEHDIYRTLTADVSWAGGWFADVKNSPDGYIRAAEWERIT